MTTKKIFITGGATRIGAAIAKSLANYETIILKIIITYLRGRA